MANKTPAEKTVLAVSLLAEGSRRPPLTDAQSAVKVAIDAEVKRGKRK